ncbi:MAG: hypothetical protein HPY52_08170 [Firmicutes bacterium]|nr:hypothetical protein [Bacillota bacterium]
MELAACPTSHTWHDAENLVDRKERPQIWRKLYSQNIPKGGEGLAGNVLIVTAQQHDNKVKSQ